MIRPALAAALLLAAAPVSAHDFWIETDRASVAESEPVHATFRVGTAAAVEDWNLRRERIVALRSIGPDGVSDQQAEIEPGKPGRATLRFKGAGTHVVTLETTPVESDLPADEFSAYVEHEALSAVRDWRAANGQTGARGRETYARRAKALMQVGGRFTDTPTRPLGLSLEIVPEINPLMLKGDAQLPLRLWFRGKPLGGAQVSLERLDAPGKPLTARTDNEGRAQFAIAKAGRWKVATVWSVPIKDNPRAEFDTLFASLTFGY